MTRSSRLMPVTRGISPTWGNDWLASLGGRHGSMQEQGNQVAVNGIRRRQGRVTSMPDQRHVDETREDERRRGGPPAPHNSLDLSIISLSETIAIVDDAEAEVFYNHPLIGDFDEGDIVPPLGPSEATAILDSGLAQRTSLNTTIDLTDSPVRSSTTLSLPSSSPVRQPSLNNNPSPPSAASLKCPVCLESFSSIRKRGSRLVSTLCGHVFCGKCLPACVRTSGLCPTCRKSIGYKDFHPLYLY